MSLASGIFGTMTLRAVTFTWNKKRRVAVKEVPYYNYPFLEDVESERTVYSMKMALHNAEEIRYVRRRLGKPTLVKINGLFDGWLVPVNMDLQFTRNYHFYWCDLDLEEIPQPGTVLVNSSEYGSVTLEDLSGIQSDILHPLSHEMEYLVDTTNKYIECQFKIVNLREEHNPSIISSDVPTTFWSIERVDSSVPNIDAELNNNTDVVKRGSCSAQVSIITGGYKAIVLHHTFSVAQDWSNYDFIAFWIYGQNTGYLFKFKILTPDINNHAYWDLYDNFEGWRRVVLPLRKLTETVGTYDLTNVADIRFTINSLWGWSGGETIYIDHHIVLDVGQWAKFEAMCPDTISGSVSSFVRSWDVNINDWKSQNLFGWREDYIGYGSTNRLCFLDGSYGNEIWGYAYKGGRAYGKDVYGTVPSATSDHAEAGLITYSTEYGSKYRIGFAIKMPPYSDYSDINKALLKLRIYYESSETSLSV